jgi:DNA invertase Pin-like site-specific DNA recombinase
MRRWYPCAVGVGGGDVEQAARTPAIGYVTVAAGAGEGDERASAGIEAACEGRDWDLLEIVRDHEGTRMLERPGLSYALRRIADGHADALVIGEVRRLSRSLVDLGTLLEWFRDAGATLIALDLALDTTSPLGGEVANTLITLSAWERERIADRTRSGMARLRAEGSVAGRPSVSRNPELLARIAAMREDGMTLQAISDVLNGEGIPTLRGGAKWRPSSVQAALGYRRPHARNPRDHLPPTGAPRHPEG